MPVDVRALDVDLLVSRDTSWTDRRASARCGSVAAPRLLATMTGGKQERSRRAGTENVPAIVGLGVAAEYAGGTPPTPRRQAPLRDRLEHGVLARPGHAVNGAAARVPNTTNIGFEGIEAESLLIALDLDGIAVSTGSACSSGTLEPSHVLKAMGLPLARTQNAMRISVGAAPPRRTSTRSSRRCPPSSTAARGWRRRGGAITRAASSSRCRAGSIRRSPPPCSPSRATTSSACRCSSTTSRRAGVRHLLHASTTSTMRGGWRRGSAFPHYIVNFESHFHAQVVSDLRRRVRARADADPVHALQQRRQVRELLDAGRRLDAERLATGHYARIDPTPDGGRCACGAAPIAARTSPTSSSR